MENNKLQLTNEYKHAENAINMLVSISNNIADVEITEQIADNLTNSIKTAKYAVNAVIEFRKNETRKLDELKAAIMLPEKNLLKQLQEYSEIIEVKIQEYKQAKLSELRLQEAMEFDKYCAGGGNPEVYNIKYLLPVDVQNIIERYKIVSVNVETSDEVELPLEVMNVETG
jgi:chromosomal replication initiation ATPase DnaA